MGSLPFASLHQRAGDHRKRADDGGLVRQPCFRAQPGDRRAKAVDDRKPARDARASPAAGQRRVRAPHPSAARTAASPIGWPVPPLQSRAVTPSNPVLRARSPTRSPAMISSPRSPSTWLSTVSAAGMPSRPIGVFESCIFMMVSPLQVPKVGPLDRLINLDYVNQYEKIRGPLSLGTRGLRRTRDLAGDALRLCQPGHDPLGAVGGFAQPSLPGRRCPHTEGTARAGARATRHAQFRRRSAGPGFVDRDHHRGRADLSRRQLCRSRRARHARTCRDAVMGRHRRRSVRVGQLPRGVGRNARRGRGHPRRQRDRSHDRRAGAGGQRRSAGVYPAPTRAGRCSAAD